MKIISIGIGIILFAGMVGGVGWMVGAKYTMKANLSIKDYHYYMRGQSEISMEQYYHLGYYHALRDSYSRCTVNRFIWKEHEKEYKRIGVKPEVVKRVKEMWHCLEAMESPRKLKWVKRLD